MAERVGFEPTVRCRTAVFKTASLNHSDISPRGHPVRRTECLLIIAVLGTLVKRQFEKVRPGCVFVFASFPQVFALTAFCRNGTIGISRIHSVLHDPCKEVTP